MKTLLLILTSYLLGVDSSRLSHVPHDAAVSDVGGIERVEASPDTDWRSNLWHSQITKVISNNGEEATSAEAWILAESAIQETDSISCLWENVLQTGAAYVANVKGELETNSPSEDFALAIRFGTETAFFRHMSSMPSEIHTRTGLLVFLSARDIEGNGVSEVSLALAFRVPGSANDGGINSQVRLDEYGNGFQHFPVPLALMRYQISAFAPGLWSEGFPEVNLGDATKECAHGTLVLPDFGKLRVYPDGDTSDHRWWESKIIVQIEGGNKPYLRKEASAKWGEYVDFWPVERGVELSAQLLGDAGAVMVKRNIELGKKDILSELHLEADKVARRVEVFVVGLPTRDQYAVEYRILEADNRSAGITISDPHLTFLFAPLGGENKPVSEIRLSFPKERLRGGGFLAPYWTDSESLEMRVNPY